MEGTEVTDAELTTVLACQRLRIRNIEIEKVCNRVDTVWLFTFL